MQRKQYSIVGVINVTPDSYVDGGRFVKIKDVLQRAEDFRAAGADIIEIGGESTGPGSSDVSVDLELQRVLPAVKAIKREFPGLPVSVDTYKGEVAGEALRAGVSMINDVTAGRGDNEMFSIVAGYPDAKYVLMYAKDQTARTTKKPVQYPDVVGAVSDFLITRANVAVGAGVSQDNLVLDPGMGHFLSGDPRYSFEVLARLPEIVSLGYPVFISASRKSFLAGEEKLPVVDRLPGTVAASAIAVLHGAAYIRTHDVQEVRRGCEISNQIKMLRRA